MKSRITYKDVLSTSIPKKIEKQAEKLNIALNKENIAFYTVTNFKYFPGTISTINSIRLFYPNSKIYVFSETRHLLNAFQKEYLNKIENLEYISSENFPFGEIREAWQLKAHAFLYLTKKKYQAIIQCDSDLILCNNIDDFIKQSIDKDTFSGGKDFNKIYLYHLYKHYYDLFDSSFQRKDFETKEYMSTALMISSNTDRIKDVAKYWSFCVDKGNFGPQKDKIYAGHGDQGILNAILFYLDIKPNLLIDDLTSEHISSHGTTKVIFGNNKFLKSDRECYSFHSFPGSSDKFWKENYPTSSKENLKEVYQFWLWLNIDGPISPVRILGEEIFLLNKSLILSGNEHVYFNYKAIKGECLKYKYIYPFISEKKKEIMKIDYKDKFVDKSYTLVETNIHNKKESVFNIVFKEDNFIENLDLKWRTEDSSLILYKDRSVALFTIKDFDKIEGRGVSNPLKFLLIKNENS